MPSSHIYITIYFFNYMQSDVYECVSQMNVDIITKQVVISIVRFSSQLI